MKQRVVIEITASVPEDAPEKGHEAVFTLTGPIGTIIDHLKAIGLDDATVSRRGLFRVVGPRQPKVKDDKGAPLPLEYPDDRVEAREGNPHNLARLTG